MQIPKQIAENVTLKSSYPGHSIKNNTATYFPFNIAKVNYHSPKMPLLDPEKLAKAKKISDSIDPNKKYPLPSDFYIQPDQLPNKKTNKSISSHPIKEEGKMHVNDTSKNINFHRKDFKLNRSSSTFSNLIYNIKSTCEKTKRFIGNKINMNKEECFYVKFKQKTNSNSPENNHIITNNIESKKQKKEVMVNNDKLNIHTSNPDFNNGYNNQLLTDYNNMDFEWDNDLHLDARPIVYTEQLKNYITQRFVELSTPSTHELNKLLIDSNDMKPITRLLEEMEQLNQKENDFFSSHESLNSNSSGYNSDNTSDSGYYSENNTIQESINIDTLELANTSKKLDKLSSQDKSRLDVKNKIKTTVQQLPKRINIKVKSTKKTYEFNGEVYQTKTSKLRAQHNKEKYQLSKNSILPTINQTTPDTKKLDDMLKTAAIMASDVEQFGQKIMIEESHLFNIKNKLLSLEK